MNNSENKELTLRLKAIFNAAVDGIIIISDRGIIEELNPAAAKLFEYTIEEIVGKNIKILMPDNYARNHDSYLQRYKKSGEANIIGIGREVIGLKKSGELFPFWLAVSEVKLNDRTIYTGFVHDLSSIREAEKKLMHLNEGLEHKVVERTFELERVVNRLLDLNKRFEDEIIAHIFTESLLKKKELELLESLAKEKELGELKTRFVSMASHEFRTPLSTILSSISLLSRYTESEQQPNRDKHITKIKSSVTHLTGILNDFLSISKFDEGKIYADYENFDLHECCKETVEELSTLLKENQKIQFKFLSAKSMIFSDVKIIKNILINLLSNAIKYSKEDGIIQLKVQNEMDYFLIRIEDSGIGIPEDDQKYLFERFFRASNSSNIEGTGLGLNIVKKYLELIKGNISFTSTLEQGTTFKVSIPEK